jgi:phage terminase small subunit
MPGGNAELVVVEPVDPTIADLEPLDAFDQAIVEAYWLARTDAPAAALCRMMLEERQLMVRSGADRKQILDQTKQITELLGQLGFTPASRTRMALGEVKRVSKLEEMRDRQARKQEMAAKVANRPDRSGDR